MTAERTHPGARTPRVSILIPNYNNGVQSARNGRDDVITELLQSLHDTLHDDPTPFEIIVYDDGSTDDSVATLRRWAKRTWRDGTPFLRLIEDQHCGVLARTANIMSRQARGDILARLDGDVVCLTRHWVSKLAQLFDEADPRVGVLGPKQLKISGNIHAFGDFILHPHGYLHVACGFPRQSVRHRLEVDHVMGCFYCCRKRVFDELGGYDEDFLRGQTIDFGLRARLAGWRCYAIPEIEFIHQHGKRLDRATEADTEAGVLKTLGIFEQKWGFNRLAPDLERVQRLYAGTPLLWNPLLFGADVPRLAVPPVPPFAESQWARYAQDAAEQARTHVRLAVTLDVLRQAGAAQQVAVLGAGEGLVTHLLAARGVPCVAFDDRPAHLQFARQCIERQKYPQQRPRYEAVPDLARLPLGDQSVDLVLIDSVLERHPNPVKVLREAWRVLRPGRYMAVVAQRGPRDGFDPSEPLAFAQGMTTQRRYQWLELVTQTQAVGGWSIAIDVTKDDVKRDLVLIVRREEQPGNALPEVRRQARVA